MKINRKIYNNLLLNLLRESAIENYWPRKRVDFYKKINSFLNDIHIDSLVSSQETESQLNEIAVKNTLLFFKNCQKIAMFYVEFNKNNLDNTVVSFVNQLAIKQINSLINSLRYLFINLEKDKRKFKFIFTTRNSGEKLKIIKNFIPNALPASTAVSLDGEFVSLNEMKLEFENLKKERAKTLSSYISAINITEFNGLDISSTGLKSYNISEEFLINNELIAASLVDFFYSLDMHSYVEDFDAELAVENLITLSDEVKKLTAALRIPNENKMKDISIPEIEYGDSRFEDLSTQNQHDDDDDDDIDLYNLFPSRESEDVEAPQTVKKPDKEVKQSKNEDGIEIPNYYDILPRNSGHQTKRINVSELEDDDPTKERIKKQFSHLDPTKLKKPTASSKKMRARHEKYPESDFSKKQKKEEDDFWKNLLEESLLEITRE